MTNGHLTDFHHCGWAVIPPTPEMTHWAKTARGLARAEIPGLGPEQWRCDGTWCVGLDALPNDSAGHLHGADFVSEGFTFLSQGSDKPIELHPAQLSLVVPGYPRKGGEETKAAFGYRLRRDAAHIDGLRPEGPERRRYMRELHGFILGVPLGRADPGASPLVLWDASHHLMAEALREALHEYPKDSWDEADITEAYQAARRVVFARCKRIEIAAPAGAQILMHRHLLHGIAPWQDGASAEPEGRMIAYFRPETFRTAADWLGAA